MKTTATFGSFGRTVTAGAGENILSVDRQAMMDLLGQHGFVLFKGFATTPEVFAAFTDLYSRKHVLHGAQIRETVSKDSVTKTVNTGVKRVDLHSEMHFSPYSPDLIWFYCEKAARKGGETLVCDGKQVFESLSPAVQKLLTSKDLKYKCVWGPAEWQAYFLSADKNVAMQKLREKGALDVTIDGDGYIQFFHKTPAVSKSKDGAYSFANSIFPHHQYKQDRLAFQPESEKRDRHDMSFADGTEVSAALIEEARVACQRLVQGLKWEDGDIVMIDNRRVLHGRGDLDPAEIRKLYIRMAEL